MSRSILNKMRRTLQHVSISAQRSISYVAQGIVRVFQPTEDNYPKTGVQPFQGDSAEK